MATFDVCTERVNMMFERITRVLPFGSAIAKDEFIFSLRH